ncbi:cyclin-dependent kinase inhibitor 3 family protein [Microcoleus sp. FACHB-1515]|uniref:cyclin-dependent kinase inhibitor 3 family protein n=1 Tax=Cyanophyceae TaxID=3028117 RepID=UPI001684A472|nr:cyclin-dependent kinase inhibitor 3 family protein [Microcoleus sp. FACHB-1515]MBD2092681.1 cyclin-dependent kinase inhibitor 3 family protein [Microcoleus sp. FACHB-1515]
MLPIATSNSHPLFVDFLITPVPIAGRIGLTLAPGKRNMGMTAHWQRDLAVDLDRLRDCYQPDWLVSLLEPHELEFLQIPDLFEQAQARGMQIRHFPIPDFSVPRSMDQFTLLVQNILATAAAGKTIVIHCKAGLGRSGLVAASCLVALGSTPAEAFQLVRRSRPGTIETAEQEAFVQAFAERNISFKPTVPLPSS